jgi:tetratricopeptide (TPR) repeat protein
MSQDNKHLNQISKELENLYQTRKQNLVLYWRAYLQFYSSIYYLKKGDKKTAEKEIDKGINWLKEMKNKNSEDYALLAMLQGFGIQFKGMKAMFISGDIKKNAQTAIALDSTNLRAYYVYASNDFHTPEKYGGGKECEKYLLKAISLPSQKIKNEYLPSWGKEESYEMLIKYYIRKKKWDLAKKYYQEGIKEFPESYVINQLASKLVGK